MSGFWQVIRSECVRRSDGGRETYINVVPRDGSTHKMAPDCTCEPKRSGQSRLITHEVRH